MEHPPEAWLLPLICSLLYTVLQTGIRIIIPIWQKVTLRAREAEPGLKSYYMTGADPLLGADPALGPW